MFTFHVCSLLFSAIYFKYYFLKMLFCILIAFSTNMASTFVFAYFFFLHNKSENTEISQKAIHHFDIVMNSFQVAKKFGLYHSPDNETETLHFQESSYFDLCWKAITLSQKVISQYRYYVTKWLLCI